TASACSTAASVERATSVSSNRSTTLPPRPRANSQLKSIVRTVPTWKSPVGLGGMRTQTGRDTAGQSRCMSAHRTADYDRPMQYGAHLGVAGGAYKALDRARAIGATSLQIFTQSPRMWRHPVVE